jgi:hypothetical protein
VIHKSGKKSHLTNTPLYPSSTSICAPKNEVVKASLRNSPSTLHKPFDEMPPSTTQAPVWFLDYTKCSLAELRKFIKCRTTPTLGRIALWKLNRQSRIHLVARLRQMDQDATFTCFMELPPELRASILESLLVDARVWDEGRATGWSVMMITRFILPCYARPSKSTPRRGRSCTTRTNPMSPSRTS